MPATARPSVPMPWLGLILVAGATLALPVAGILEGPFAPIVDNNGLYPHASGKSANDEAFRCCTEAKSYSGFALAEYEPIDFIYFWTGITEEECTFGCYDQAANSGWNVRCLATQYNSASASCYFMDIGRQDRKDVSSISPELSVSTCVRSSELYCGD